MHKSVKVIFESYVKDSVEKLDSEIIIDLDISFANRIHTQHS